MDAATATRITGLEHKTEELRKAIVERSVDNSSGNRSQIILNLNAGKFSAWIAAVTCLLVLAFFAGAAMTAGLWFSREFTKIDTRFSDVKNNDDIHDLQVQKLETRIERLSKQEKK